MLANARKDHSIPLQIFAEMNNVETRNNREDGEDIVITDDDTEETKDFKHVKVITQFVQKLLACSRLSIAGSEKRESERKNEGALRRGRKRERAPRLSPPSFFSRSFSLVPIYQEPGTG